jgi:hypothetical protein
MSFFLQYFFCVHVWRGEEHGLLTGQMCHDWETLLMTHVFESESSLCLCFSAHFALVMALTLSQDSAYRENSKFHFFGVNGLTQEHILFHVKRHGVNSSAHNEVFTSPSQMTHSP